MGGRGGGQTSPSRPPSPSPGCAPASPSAGPASPAQSRPSGSRPHPACRHVTDPFPLLGRGAHPSKAPVMPCHVRRLRTRSDSMGTCCSAAKDSRDAFSTAESSDLQKRIWQGGAHRRSAVVGGACEDGGGGYGGGDDSESEGSNGGAAAIVIVVVVVVVIAVLMRAVGATRLHAAPGCLPSPTAAPPAPRWAPRTRPQCAPRGQSPSGSTQSPAATSARWPAAVQTVNRAAVKGPCPQGDAHGGWC